MGVFETVVPPIEAFAVAAVAVYIDCYQTARKQVARVPAQVLQAPGIVMLAAIVGLIAVGLFLYASGLNDVEHIDAIDTIISLKIKDHYLLAPYVGLLSLAIIRRKLLDLKTLHLGWSFFIARGVFARSHQHLRNGAHGSTSLFLEGRMPLSLTPTISVISKIISRTLQKWTALPRNSLQRLRRCGGKDRHLWIQPPGISITAP